MTTTCFDFDFLQTCQACMHVDKSKPEAAPDATASSLTAAVVGLQKDYDLLKELPYLSESDDVVAKKVAQNILNSTSTLNPLAISAYMHDADWFADREIFAMIWRQLLEVGISPFLLHRSVPKMQSLPDGTIKIPRIPGPISLWRAIDFLVVLLKLAHCHEGYSSLVDSVILVLADFSGSLKNPKIDSIISHLNLDPKLQYLAEVGASSRSKTKFLSLLMTSVSARAALCTLLQVVHNNPTYIRSSWSVVWLTLCQMRDSALLPLGMVSDAEADLLPSQIRLEFESRMLSSLRAEKQISGSDSEPKQKRRLVDSDQ